MPERCDGAEPSHWSVGLSEGGFATQIVFPDARVNTRQLATNVSVGWAPRVPWSFSATASLVGGGEIGGRDVRGGGAGLSVGAGWLALYERDARPFVVVTGDAGASRVRAPDGNDRARDWLAGDVRGGVTAGKSFGAVVPYLALRAFGGPVSWRVGGRDEVGGDATHVTAGVGLTLRAAGDADFTAEVMPLGERSATIGVTWRVGGWKRVHVIE